MVFPLYVTLERMDRTLVEASKDLGAGRWATFRQITLPIALPGLITGSILVFIPMMGEYVIPQILGYGQVVHDRQRARPALPRVPQLAGRVRPRRSALILVMLVDDLVLPVVHEPRPADPRRERPVRPARAPPAVPLAGRPRDARQGEAGVDRTAGLVEAWLRAHTLLVYAFLYLPIIVVVVFSFNGTTQRVTRLGGLQPPLVRVRPGQNNEVQRYLLEQRDRRAGRRRSSRRSSGRWRRSGSSASRAGSACRSMP